MRAVKSGEVNSLVQGRHSKSGKLRLAFLLGLRPVFFLRSCCGLTLWREGCFSSLLSYTPQLYQWILSTVPWHSSVQRKPTLWCNGFHFFCCLEECATRMSVLSFKLLCRKVSWLLEAGRTFWAGQGGFLHHSLSNKGHLLLTGPGKLRSNILPNNTELHIRGCRRIDAALLQKQKVSEVGWDWIAKKI